MSFQDFDIKDYKITKTLHDYGIFKEYLVEELKTKRLKSLYQFSLPKLTLPKNSLAQKSMIDHMFKSQHSLFTVMSGYCLNYLQGELSILLHYIPYGNIAKILEDESNGKFIPEFTSTKRYIVLLGISFALKHDHSKGNVNCSLSSSSIYIDDEFYPRFLKDLPFSQTKIEEIDSIYKSSEILNGHEYTYASDVYSFSIILYELITGKKPIVKNGEFTDLSVIKSECIRNLISKCSSKNPEERPTFCEIAEILMKDEVKNFFNVNEEEVVKYLELVGDDLKNPNLFKPLIDDANSSEGDSTEMLIGEKYLRTILGNNESLLNYPIIFEDERNSMSKEKSFQDQENLDEMNKLGIKYFYGKDVEVDQQKGLHYFHLAADKGDVNAMINLGSIYLDVLPDINKSLYYYKKAAEKGNFDGLYKYGHILFYHLNDIEKGIHYIKIAADNGCLLAMKHYAFLLLTNQNFQNEKKEAVKYFEKCIKYGDIDSMLNYGRMLFDGDGIEMNRKKGIQLIKKSADLGDVKAMQSYISCFINSKDSKDSNKLFTNNDIQKYIKMLIKTGNPLYFHLYSEMLAEGIGMPIDLEKSLYYIKLAADNGLVEAMYQYGIRCRDGKNKNKVEAAHYLKMAADKGNEIAMQNYAVMLHEGDGIPRDDEEALKYMKMAADAGNAYAIMALSIL